MSPDENHNPTCQICGQQKPANELLPGELLRDDVVKDIRQDFPHWDPAGFICTEDLRRYRMKHMRARLEAEHGGLTNADQAFLETLGKQPYISRNIASEIEENYTVGQRIADKVASFGGSWAFILIFTGILILWVIMNGVVLLSRAFDPYPFILLNLVLSCVAALQAPVIMMSQNRQEAKDRQRAEHDYYVNLKAEWEIQQLHEKMDNYLIHQWHHLLEIQRTQIKMMRELLKEAGVEPAPKDVNKT